MTDLERARYLVGIFDRAGERWRDYVPVDCPVQGQVITVGTETLIRCTDGVFRRLVEA